MSWRQLNDRRRTEIDGTMWIPNGPSSDISCYQVENTGGMTGPTGPTGPPGTSTDYSGITGPTGPTGQSTVLLAPNVQTLSMVPSSSNFFAPSANPNITFITYTLGTSGLSFGFTQNIVSFTCISSVALSDVISFIITGIAPQGSLNNMNPNISGSAYNTSTGTALNGYWVFQSNQIYFLGEFNVISVNNVIKLCPSQIIYNTN